MTLDSERPTQEPIGAVGLGAATLGDRPLTRTYCTRCGISLPATSKERRRDRSGLCPSCIAVLNHRDCVDCGEPAGRSGRCPRCRDRARKATPTPAPVEAS